ncbi:MAG: pentapeptide repeat-containing protein, partial [Trichodesmium sp. St18_bin1]|nr:pentapeptide repeat-containing protein [Trichodesmium sp. St18_bin1]
MLTHSYKQPRKNYQGRSFKEQDLTNQDFSYADIRGADFTGANLTGAKFNYALAGLTKSQVIRLFIITAILSVTAGLSAFIAVYFPSNILRKSNEINHLIAIIFISLEFVNIGLLVIIIIQGISKAIRYLFCLFSLFILIISILASLALREEKVNNYFRLLGVSEAPNWIVWLSGELRMFRGGNLTISVIDWLKGNEEVNLILSTMISLIISIVAIFVLIFTLSIAVILAKIIAEKWLINIVVAGAGILAVIVGILAIDSSRFSYSWMLVISALSFCLTLILIGQHLAKKILSEDENNLFILRLAIGIGTIGGTCFKSANLTDADFSHGILKSTNFRFANAT